MTVNDDYYSEETENDDEKSIASTQLIETNSTSIYGSIEHIGKAASGPRLSDLLEQR